MISKVEQLNDEEQKRIAELLEKEIKLDDTLIIQNVLESLQKLFSKIKTD